MTPKHENTIRISKLKKRTSAPIAIFLTILIFMAAIFLSDDLSVFAKSGLLLSSNVIIPSVFPFLLLCDATMPYIQFESMKPVRFIFEKCFNISGCALSAFICGILCGFPIGAKLALSLYKCGKISKDECERLMAFSNNASPGYIISAIGIGMRGNLSDGLVLYFSTVISAIITGILVGIGKEKTNFSPNIYKQNYNFVESVKNSTLICLTICGFITTFSILSGLLYKAVNSEMILYFILPFLEIGNAATIISKSNYLLPVTSLILTAFSIGFSGLSVCAQTKSLISNEDVSFFRYVLIKLLQGLITVIVTLLIYKIINYIYIIG